MKNILFVSLLLGAFGLHLSAQKQKTAVAGSADNTLLWRISGKNLSRPSYVFGTMHLLCGDDLKLSDSLKAAIQGSDNVYLELEMDNMFEMLGAMGHMSMKNDTTLADLLSKSEYQTVKSYFETNASILPFSMLETFKPMLAASMIGEQQLKTSCDKLVAMESLIMEEAKDANKKVKGLETMNYQLSIFDKIPYRLQAKQLYKMIQKPGDTTGVSDMAELTTAYRNQQLGKLEQLTLKEDQGMKNFSDLLIYQRNETWAKKLNELMMGKSLVVAVGAGHLPGKKGVLNLLRLAGYKVEPVKNEMTRTKTREI